MTQDPSTFHAASTDDLQLPLQQAFAQALQRGGAWTVRLAPGTYEAGAVSLHDTGGDSRLDLTIESAGPGPAVLRGMALSVSARSVVLRGLVLTEGTMGNSILDVGISRSLVAERVALVGNRREGRDVSAALVQVRARYQAEGGSVTLRDSWLLDNSVAGDEPLLATPKDGRGYLQSLLLENVVMAGNRAAAGLAPWFTRSTILRGCTVYEPHVSGGWLRRSSPLANVAIEGGLLAVGGEAGEVSAGGGALAGRPASPDLPEAWRGRALQVARPDPQALRNEVRVEPRR